MTISAPVSCMSSLSAKASEHGLEYLAWKPKAPKPLQTAGRGRVVASETGLDRVESRDWVTATRVLQGFPRALVAPADGTRTTDVAVFLPAATADG
jgi:hypothetical protein